MEEYKRVNELLNTQYKSDSEIEWYWISRNKKLSESFIREFKDKVSWYWISLYQKLSESFIREFQDKVDWDYISANQNLSEAFIREFQDNVSWYWISKYQKLSEFFIREFKDKVDWDYISKYQKLSKIFRLRFLLKMNRINIRNSWHYKNSEFKKRQVVETGLYECHDDYFIAYKGIRSDRYSAFNFQYRYEPGNTYESWCDCSSDENSFGLSVWSEDKARDYFGELVVKCKVRYEDVGRVVHDGGKIRCFKIEILN